jgi:predicted nucleic acid-binding protein
MIIDRSTLVFFDSSCLIAAAGNPTGGSGFLLLLCSRGFLKAAVSQPVLLEAQMNIQRKLGDQALKHFYNLLTIVPFLLASLPGEAELSRFEKLVNRKDVHVIAAALEVQAPFLLALDKGLVLEVNQANLGVQALSPADFIKSILPLHANYPAGRD